MTHALTADLLLSYLNAALFTYLVFMTNTLIFAAQAFPVLCRSENALAKQAVALCLKCAVVYGLGLFDFAVGP